MIAQLLASFGAVAASVGLVVFGMGTAFVEPDDSLKNLGYILMIGGVIATIIGGVMYRATLHTRAAAATERTTSSTH